jgi:hypothetical protein
MSDSVEPYLRAGTDKLRELILHICIASSDDPNFGKTKLNKIVFFSDFGFFRQFGRSITGQSYYKLPYGPCAKTVPPLLSNMKAKQEFAFSETSFYDQTQQKPVALRRPDLSLFTAEEIAFVDSVIVRYKSFTGKQISDASHESFAWKLTGLNEEIPIATALLENRPLTQKESQYASTLDIAGAMTLLTS